MFLVARVWFLKGGSRFFWCVPVFLILAHVGFHRLYKTCQMQTRYHYPFCLLISIKEWDDHLRHVARAGKPREENFNIQMTLMYNSFINYLIGLNDATLTEFREIEARDKKRFEFADTDNDNLLSREELTLFLHPEESKRMTSYLVEVIIACRYNRMAGKE